MDDRARAEFLVQRNQRLLDSIVNLDYETYDSLCADDMSCMEPESNQNLVIGKGFHKYYFDVFGGSGGEPMTSPNNSSDNCNGAPTTHTKVTMVQPHVQWIRGSATSTNTNTASDRDRQQTKEAAAVPTGAVLSYVKLTQQTTVGNAPVTIQQSETRVWEYRNTTNGGWVWVNIHFHKSPVLQ
eukprot:GHVN01075887.1.p1 GENE.GHVN01075887.1~~GHVN01075887.1.p1  ORF type:complete len:183 (-),score=3.91 GHVN01075887.1:535-1083(-)